MTAAAEPSRTEAIAETAATAATTGCRSNERRPGRLRYLLRRDITTFDPAKSPEVWIMAALFEPLIQPHPETMEPMAGLATHYVVDRNGTRYTFYLRGHSAPQGNKLA